MSAADPLLVTLRCEGGGWRYCEDLRERHFPAARNLVPAHIMLFHHLPGEELNALAFQAGEIARAMPPFSPLVNAVRSLGRGVALRVDSRELLNLHRALSVACAKWLIPQDRMRYSPHITIQNKVTGEQARSLIAELGAAFMPFSIDALGLDIWHYRGGPWEHAVFLAFNGLS